MKFDFVVCLKHFLDLAVLMQQCELNVANSFFYFPVIIFGVKTEVPTRFGYVC